MILNIDIFKGLYIWVYTNIVNPGNTMERCDGVGVIITKATEVLSIADE